MKMKRLLCWLIVFPVVIATLLVATISPASVLPLGQPSAVYASPEIETLRPNAPGTNLNWTASAGEKYACVNETSPDEDITYVYTTGNQVHDSYNLDDHVTGSGTISNVRVYVRARSLTSGKELAVEIVIGGVNYAGAKQILTISYEDYYENWAQNPATTANWTWTEIDALEAGVRTYVAKGVEHRVTTVWVEVTYAPAVAPDISNTPDNYDFGTVSTGSSYETGITYVVDSTGFRITNNNVAYDVNITISATGMGSGWLLADSGDPDATHYTLWAGTELTSPDYNIQVTSGGTFLVTVLASNTRDWGLKLMTPTSFSDGGLKEGTVTLTATTF